MTIISHLLVFLYIGSFFLGIISFCVVTLYPRDVSRIYGLEIRELQRFLLLLFLFFFSLSSLLLFRLLRSLIYSPGGIDIAAPGRFTAKKNTPAKNAKVITATVTVLLRILSIILASKITAVDFLIYFAHIIHQIGYTCGFFLK